MMENRINITFPDKSISVLSGNKNGVRLFEEQISKSVKKTAKNIIVFPENIEFISISFTKGMFKHLIETFGSDNLFDSVDVVTSSEWLTSKVKGDVFRW